MSNKCAQLVGAQRCARLSVCQCSSVRKCGIPSVQVLSANKRETTTNTVNAGQFNCMCHFQEEQQQQLLTVLVVAVAGQLEPCPMDPNCGAHAQLFPCLNIDASLEFPATGAIPRPPLALSNGRSRSARPLEPEDCIVSLKFGHESAVAHPSSKDSQR